MQNSVAFRNVENLFHKCFGIVHDRLEFFAAVAYFHKRETGVLKVSASVNGGFDYLLGQYGRSRVEIIFLHYSVCFVVYCFCFRVSMDLCCEITKNKRLPQI